MILLVAGGKWTTPREKIHIVLDEICAEHEVEKVVTPVALGVDRYVAEWCADCAMPVVIVASSSNLGGLGIPMLIRRLLDYEPDAAVIIEENQMTRQLRRACAREDVLLLEALVGG